MPVSHHVSPEVDCQLVRCNEEVEYERELWTLVKLVHGQLMRDVSLLLFVLHHSFIHLYFENQFATWRTIAALRQFCVGMPMGYSLGSIVSIYFPSPGPSYKSLPGENRLMGRAQGD